VSQELLDVIERHAGVEEDCGDAGAEAMGRDLLRDLGLGGRLATVALEEVATATTSQVCAQLLREAGQHGDIPIAAPFAWAR
jgi:hypothetical protein